MRVGLPPPAPLTQKQIVLKNLLVNYYEQVGDQGGFALIFLHGWRSEGKVWLPIMNSRSLKRYSCYAIDFSGFGKSETPRSPFALKDYVEVLEEFIEKLKLKNIILVGHSFGGRVAIKLAANTPLLIEKLILVDSAGLKGNDSIYLDIKKTAAKAVKPLFSRPFMKPWQERIYKLVGAEDYLARPDLKETFINIINEDLIPLLKKIKIPTLIIWGENDRVTPLDFAYKLKEDIPNSELVILSNAGHFSFLDQKEEFLENLIKFL